MKLKLGENIGSRGVRFPRAAGHDVATVLEQNLCSSPDIELISVCRKEQRRLVTLDLDFGNPLLFKPDECHGIAVLRVPPRPGPKDLDNAVKTLIAGLARENIVNKLWIVQPGRIREYQNPRDAG